MSRPVGWALTLLFLAAPLLGAGPVETWKQPDELPSNNVNGVHRGEDGVLWIATDRGLVRRDAEGSRVLTQADGLPSDYIYFVLAARDGAVYAGTDQGLAILRDGTVTVLRTGEGSPGDWFYRGVQDPAGTIWISIRGHGLLRWEESGSFVHDPESGLPTWYVNDVELSPRGEVWIAGYQGIAVQREDGWEGYTEADGLVATNSFAVLRDSKDRIWQGSWGNGVSMNHGGRWQTWRKGAGLRSGFITDLVEDRRGLIYAATAGGGLSVFQNGSWLPGAYIPKDCFVNDLYVDPAGTLYISTTGHGLVVVSESMPQGDV